MIEIEARLQELRSLGLHRRTRLVSGPQGPHVVLDGKPVLLLCSHNYLGLADHPRVREAAADAATRWGAGACCARQLAGTMTIHRRLEERLARFCARDSALLFSSGWHAATGAIPALARPGDVIFSDELAPASIVDGCRLSRADVFVYGHCDVEHLAWGLERAGGRAALIVSPSVFALDGDVAPLEELVELAQEWEVRLLVDEAHGIGVLGPGGRGGLAELGLEEQVDVIIGALDTALGSHGAFVACDDLMARYLTAAARTLTFSSALPPPAVAGALAALDLLESRPDLVDRLAANSITLRQALELEGFELVGGQTPIVSVVLGESAPAGAVAEAALARGAFVQPIGPPVTPADIAGVRLTVMASHRPGELRAAARVLGLAARDVGFDPAAAGAAGAVDAAPAPAGVFDYEARAA
jgi:glycine C-acetyltransferase/8-amino-7-oxononanoate synthase